MVNLLEQLFPRLSSGIYKITSPKTKRYNCIAWAAGDDSQWWWPGPDLKLEYWPPGVARLETVEAFCAAFGTLGYLATAHGHAEIGIEKIALFADATGEPKHAARQLENGRWSSKVGLLEDIEHDLRDLEGADYGSVVAILQRARRTN